MNILKLNKICISNTSISIGLTVTSLMNFSCEASFVEVFHQESSLWIAETPSESSPEKPPLLSSSEENLKLTSLKEAEAEGKEESGEKEEKERHTLVHSFLTTYRGWKIYCSQRIVLAGFALAFLYVTVLGFDNITTGICHAILYAVKYPLEWDSVERKGGRSEWISDCIAVFQILLLCLMDILIALKVQSVKTIFYVFQVMSSNKVWVNLWSLYYWELVQWSVSWQLLSSHTSGNGWVYNERAWSLSSLSLLVSVCVLSLYLSRAARLIHISYPAVDQIYRSVMWR